MRGTALSLNQFAQLENPDARIILSKPDTRTLLAVYAKSVKGMSTGDDPRYVKLFWELEVLESRYVRYETTVDASTHYGGKTNILDWQSGLSPMRFERGARIQGVHVWKQPGVIVSLMRKLAVTLHRNAAFDQNVALLHPRESGHLPAIWCFCSSLQFNTAVRTMDQALKVTNATLVKVPFDLAYWQAEAARLYPAGLPEPYSDDPTQWLFRGDIPSSTEPLQVAMARLLGYRWPDQPKDGLETHEDRDGIVTLAPLVEQEGAASRLRALLQEAYRSPAPPRPRGAPPVEEPRAWDETVIPRLLARAGCPGLTLEEWLRDRFFNAHCRIFQQRPFLWHIWDGRRDGFHAYVNYHRLDGKNLERLAYIYLGEWIERQEADQTAGDPTAEGRVRAARGLQEKLDFIRQGEDPYDIFVRWKPLGEQPLGWQPDLNDGVRLNIRPFMTADILHSVPRISWGKDRGKDPKPNASGTVERHNDRHFTLAQKRAAREESSRP
jgi:hypothetical protein